jgi:F-type H+-transporting ATPase subunit b
MLPQLDPHNFAPQLIWLAIFFVTLYVLMSRLALPKVSAILEEREKRLAGDRAEAVRLRDEMTKAIAEYEQALIEAKHRAQSIASKARAEIAADVAQQRAASDAQIATKMVDAEKSIDLLKNEAMAHIGEIATDTAQAVVARLLGKTIDSAELHGAVNEALGK